MLKHTHEELLEVVKTLNGRIWENRLSNDKIERWLGNFPSDVDYALHLLAHFSYFGELEMRVLLRALFRDLYRYPIIQEIRAEHGDTFDRNIIEPRFGEELTATRFLGMGNPSESGTYLLYYFRQENKLPVGSFVNSHEIFLRVRGGVNVGERILRDEGITRYVFLDDICGSGTQAIDYSESIVEDIIRLNPDASVSYFCLFGTEKGLANIRSKAAFSDVRALFVLDESFRCFSADSRYYLEDERDACGQAAAIMRAHGETLLPGHPLGYKNGQLLLGFFYNIPDNVLPIFWSESNGWTPIFRRYHKVY